ncbi:conserved repeat domain-containing protein/Por secretion system C-terminal sorting domain-containing protein [Flavobacterium resistens]|uniref:Conserved repeat domain-containing protein/Por secretion system C-terminal sorting domain-containing protein n=1 Tax=Flavobacterium resistens TaxID=443612 RepID=A0A521AL11_9FLAO|nr:T9SS type A sorting domain-containing protein [Flavobacterium resistens]MRX69884.1 T9SS type A sorting domain-containing protein [Flavobacterium resistens]SMO35473.1 conserved repeat domain-containing protein/Por secretion system C-terminal sorting domain-containing protein [Flavobacterium resistens]
MKKNYFLLLVFFVFLHVNSQSIVFPNDFLRQKLLQAQSYSPYLIAKNQAGIFFKVDSNNDGEIDINEAKEVSHLDLSSYGFNDLNGINNFPNLKELVCKDNSLTQIDLTTLINLEKLDCSTNRLTALDLKNQLKMTELVCDHNQLTSIVLNDQNVLTKLICFSNQFSDFNFNKTSKLKELNCSGNKFTAFDFTSLSDLKILDFSYNAIKTIDLRNLINLTSLYFTNNLVSSIDLSENKLLQKLYCDNNKLTSLDLKNQGLLTDFYCENNLLTTLDLSGLKSLFSLNCNYNQITYLNLKNSAHEMFTATGNDLKYVCIDDDERDFIELHLKSSNIYNCNINSYCSFSPGGDYYAIEGNQKFDSNNDGCNQSDSSFRNLSFLISNGSISGNFISDDSGNYRISVSQGTHTITPILENPNYFTVTPASATVTFPAESTTSLQNFCIAPKGNHQDVEISILSLLRARPGFDATYKIVYKNKANKTVSGSVALDFNDAVLDYVSSVPNTSNQSTNKLVWDYVDLKPLETREILITLNVNSPMETLPVNNNDRLSFNVLITPVVGDEKPVDNSFAMRQTVVGSFDPNDKTCLEGDVITPELIGEYVHYLIRFENTGTYFAENIVVKDIIDTSKFDISTLVPTNSSHSYITKISNGNKVEFIFEKINLPFDDAHNDGYIAFKIKTLPTLKVGDSFTNEANIYFDYNFPILTNKTTSTFKTLGTSDFEFSQYFNIYPNPVKDRLNISLQNNVEIKSIEIYDVLGQLIIAVPNAINVSNIDVSKLKTGNYFLKIKSDKGVSSTKFIRY